MLQKVEMYTVVCDNCKRDIGEDEEIACWNDDSYAETNATDSDWLKDGKNHYCPACYTYDENDELILKMQSKMNSFR